MAHPQSTPSGLSLRNWLAYFPILALAVPLTLFGCAGATHTKMNNIGQALGGPEPSSEASMSSPATAGAAQDYDETTKSPSRLPRKIKRDARVELVARNLAELERQMTSLVKSEGGFVADSDVSGAPGSPRTGEWKLRVPSRRFDSFMAALVGLGELQRQKTDSEDVSEEFYDVRARLENKRVEEARLRRHLAVSTGKLTEILVVEKELSRVREEIEQMEGRIRVLTDLTDLATVTVVATETKPFSAPRETGFGSQAGRAFSDSVAALVDVGKGFVLVLITLTPWALLLALLAVPLVVLIRRHQGR